MEAQVNKVELLSALSALKFCYAADSRWPFASFAVRNDTLMVSGSDGNAFTCSAISAQINEESEVVGLVGTTLETLVKTAQGEVITLRSTEQNLFIEDEHNFKARLSRSADMPSLIDQFLEAKEKADTNISAVFVKEGLSRLLSLSNAFPPHTQSDKRWCVITTDGGLYSGSIQDTEAGAIESLPLEITYQDDDAKGDICFSTKLFQPILQQAGDTIKLQAGYKRNSRVVASDPDNPAWFTIFGQYLRPGEFID